MLEACYIKSLICSLMQKIPFDINIKRYFLYNYLLFFLLPILLSVWLISFLMFSLCAKTTIKVKTIDKNASAMDL